MQRADFPDWLTKAVLHLESAPPGLDAEGWGQRLHEALQICEIDKYATPKSRFMFAFSGASEDDIREIRRYLTPLENSIVEIERR